MRLNLSSLLLLLPTTAVGQIQAYKPMLVTNQTTVYRYAAFQVQYEYYYRVLAEDTLIDCVRYRKVLHKSDDSIYHFSKYLFLKEDTVVGKVYKYMAGGEVLLYDFNPLPLSVIYYGGQPYWFMWTDTISTSSGPRKAHHYRPYLTDPKTYEIVEGMGSKVDLDKVFVHFSDPAYYFTGLYTNNQLIYGNGAATVTPPLDFLIQHSCNSDTIRFFGEDPKNLSVWSWRFKKFKDSSLTDIFIQSPSLRFVDTGMYEARLIVGTDTVIKYFYVGLPMQMDFNLGNDTTLCEGDSLVLYPENGSHNCFQWQDLTFGSTYKVKQSGTYTVTVTDKNFCQVQDSIHITFNQVLKPALTRKGDTLFATTGNYTYQWYFNTQPVNGATQHFIVRTSDGNYQVKVTDDFGCFTFSDTYNTTGLPVINSQSIRIYPNPVNDLLHIKLTSGSEYLEQAELLNVAGQRVQTNVFPENSLHIEMNCVALPKGFYLLRLTTNTATYVRKIIIGGN